MSKQVKKVKAWAIMQHGKLVTDLEGKIDVYDHRQAAENDLLNVEADNIKIRPITLIVPLTPKKKASRK